MKKILFIIGYLLLSQIPLTPQSWNAWQSIGPFCGDVQVLITSPVNPNVLYAGNFGGIFEYNYVNGFWAPIKGNLPNLKIQAIAAANTDVIYLGSSEQGIFKTTDNGKTWSPKNRELSNLDVHALYIHPLNPNIIYVGTYGEGIFKSENGGEFWTGISRGLDNLYINQIAFLPNQTTRLLVATNRGLFISSEDGSEWFSIFSDLQFTHISAFVFEPNQSGIFYAATMNQGVYKLNLTDTTAIPFNQALPEKQILTLAMSHGSNNFLFAGTYSQGIFKRRLTAEVWEPANEFLYASRIQSLVTHPTNHEIVYVGTHEGGIYSSNDLGNSWDELNNGLAIAAVNGIVIHPNVANRIFVGVQPGIFLYKSGAKYEALLSNYKINDFTEKRIPEFRLYAATEKNGIMTSGDGGQSWFYMNSGLNYANSSITCLAFLSVSDTAGYAGTKDGKVFRFSNSRKAWENITANYANQFEEIYDLEIDPKNSDRIYAATKKGLYRKTRKSDWDELSRELPTPNTVTSIVIKPENSALIYAVLPKFGIYKSLNMGANWFQISKTFPPTEITVVQIHPKRPGRVLAGTSNKGLFMSTNDGDSWFAVESETLPDNITRISVQDSNLYIGTKSNGCYCITTAGRLDIPFSEIDLGSISVGSKKSIQLLIKNNGYDDLKILEIKTNDSNFSASPDINKILPQENATLELTFSPSSARNFLNELVLKSSDPANPTKTIQLKGKGITPQIFCYDVTSINFGKQLIRTPQQKSLAIANSGDANLIISKIDINNQKFTIIDKLPITIAPGANNFPLQLKFQPDSVKIESALMRIFSNDLNETRNPLRIALQGEGAAPLLQLNSPDSINFGEFALTRYADSSFMILNAGNFPLEIKKIQKTKADFQFLDNIPITINPQATHRLKIRFVPQTSGFKSDTIYIFTNLPDSLKNPLLLYVKGTGIDAPVKLLTDQLRLQFEAVPLYGMKELDFALLNQTFMDIEITKIQCVPELLQVNGPTSFLLKQGSQQAVKIQFKPDKVESTLGKVIVNYQSIQPESVQINITGEVAFSEGTFKYQVPSGSEQNAFRMFSVPALLNQTDLKEIFTSTLGELNPKNWRVFYWENNQYLELGQNLISDLKPGRAFWIISKAAHQVDFDAGSTVTRSQPFRIILQPGWNQIGNPFTFPVNWNNIKQMTPSAIWLDTLYHYAGEYSMADRLQPFEGYWVENRLKTDTVHLVIPTTQIATLLKTNSQLAETVWWLQIKATCDSTHDFINFLGVANTAENEWDKFDHPEPPAIGEFVSVYFPHQDWTDYPNDYTSDFLPAQSNGWNWDFTVTTNISGGDVKLEFENLTRIPSGYKVILLDQTTRIKHELSLKNYYTYLSSLKVPGERKFTLQVGANDVQDEKNGIQPVLPKNFELCQNFPNPLWLNDVDFRNSPEAMTIVQFELPVVSEVNIHIYNIIGREVKTLVKNQSLPAGIHFVKWDGRDEIGEYLPG
ncbi:choice-of-anchor D domain-containing protein, partial [candidate division KSB1 bacterium]|nr:choice-of-anchor D domain-containing protein [candidate division KSB1 bacterium]